MKKVAITLGSVVVIVVLGWFAITNLVDKPLSADLSKVGQGKPALVLAFESHSGAGTMAMDLVNQVRDNYEPEVEFLVADLGTPKGKAFASRYGLQNGTGVLLDGDGSRVSKRSLTTDAAQLRQWLDRDLERSSMAH